MALKCDFQKFAKKPPKSNKCMTQMSTLPFWGVFREVFRIRSKIWPLEVPFFGT